MIGSLLLSWSAPGALPSLTQLHLQDTLLTGSLPPSWANQEALPSLSSLYLQGNVMTGSLPLSWSNKNAFPKVAILVLANNLLTGSIPPSLSKGFPALEILLLGPSRQNGTLPTEWGCRLLSSAQCFADKWQQRHRCGGVQLTTSVHASLILLIHVHAPPS